MMFEADGVRFAKPGMEVVFLGKNGYDHQLMKARGTFQVGQRLTVKNAYIESYTSNYEFKGFEGKWNTVMFQIITDALRYQPEKEVLYAFEAERAFAKHPIATFQPVGMRQFYGLMPIEYKSAPETDLRCAALVFMDEPGFSGARAFYDYWVEKVDNADFVRLFGFIVDIQIARATR